MAKFHDHLSSLPWPCLALGKEMLPRFRCAVLRPEASLITACGAGMPAASKTRSPAGIRMAVSQPACAGCGSFTHYYEGSRGQAGSMARSDDGHGCARAARVARQASRPALPAWAPASSAHLAMASGLRDVDPPA